ncbi:MAG: PspA-associated protein PspAB [Solirubrobacteraceae bacterium]
MGLRDILTGRHQVKGPAPDRLFAISTAYITLQSEHGIAPTGAAAIVFQALNTSEFEATLRDMEEVVKATGADSGTDVKTQDDAYGYRWMILRNAPGTPSVEDLAVGINAVSSSIESAGHGERLLCAVFSFRGSQGERVYFIYNYKRGYWYPFVPKGAGASASSSSATSGTASFSRSPRSDPVDASERSTERELQLKAQLSGELPLEPELERWFPLWGIPI